MWQVLMTLARGRGGTQRDIAAAIGIEGATLTHHLNRMEDAGLITRMRVPSDRRMHQVELTEDGEEMFRVLLDRVIVFDGHLRAGLSESEEASLRALLRRLRENSAGRRSGPTRSEPRER